MKRKDTDPVILDEIRQDRIETAQTMNFERCLVRAKEMYRFGELDDWIIDDVDHRDAVMIAQAVLDYLEGYEANFETAQLNLPPLAVKDMRATIEGIIERKAQLLLEEL
jgi:hypothetical protein